MTNYNIFPAIALSTMMAGSGYATASPIVNDDLTIIDSTKTAFCLENNKNYNVLERRIWENPGGNPTNLSRSNKESLDFAEYMATCHINAVNPSGIVKRISSKDFDGEAELTPEGVMFYNNSGNLVKTGDIGSMSFGDDTYVLDVRADRDILDDNLTAKYINFTKEDGTVGYFLIWDVCGNFGEGETTDLPNGGLEDIVSYDPNINSHYDGLHNVNNGNKMDGNNLRDFGYWPGFFTGIGIGNPQDIYFITGIDTKNIYDIDIITEDCCDDNKVNEPTGNDDNIPIIPYIPYYPEMPENPDMPKLPIDTVGDGNGNGGENGDDVKNEIPLPPSIALIGAGLFGLGARKRQK